MVGTAYRRVNTKLMTSRNVAELSACVVRSMEENPGKFPWENPGKSPKASE